MKIGDDNIENTQIFIHIETKVRVNLEEKVKIKDLASIACVDNKLKEKLLDIEIFESPNEFKNIVISTLQIINKINEKFQNIDIVIIGPPEILIDVSNDEKVSKFAQMIKVSVVSILLFFGAALAITNFHEDVNLRGSFQSIYTLVTGKKSERPLLLQIPYSIGLGVGMATFFNHILNKNKKSEPSPLEMEMHTYEKSIDDYILDKTKHNNKDNNNGD